jgi:alcohol dehydrogenase class IV
MGYQGFYDTSKDQIKVIFGEGCLASLPAEVKACGSKALLISDPVVMNETDLVQKVSNLLGSCLVAVFDETIPHTPRKVILKAADLARSSHPDCLISLGGGSTTDTAKAVRLALWMGISDDSGFDQAQMKLKAEDVKCLGAPVPQIALPTTLVGAEYTSGMGVTNEATHAKQVFVHPLLQCRNILLDPELTRYTPPVLWFSTGIKSLEHAIARLSALERHPIVDGTAALAVHIIGKELRNSFKFPDDLGARSRLQVGSWLSQFGSETCSGMRMGLSHALGRQIGSVSGVPHGLSSCVILPLSMDYNASACQTGFTIVAQALGIKTDGLAADAIGHSAADAIRSLIAEVSLPSRLRDIGVSRDVLPLISERTMHDWSIGENPRPINSADEVLALLERAW